MSFECKRGCYGIPDGGGGEMEIAACSRVWEEKENKRVDTMKLN